MSPVRRGLDAGACAADEQLQLGQALFDRALTEVELNEDGALSGFYARMYDVPQAGQRIETVLDQVGLLRRSTDPVRTYSRGMQQRLAIARAMLHNPPILLLDEPDTGLDQHAADMLSDLLSAVGISQRTILMTTHNLERGLSLGNRLVILAKGKIVYDTPRQGISLDEVRGQYYKFVTGN